MDVCAATFTPDQVKEILETDGLTPNDPCFFAERNRRYIPQHSRLVEDPGWDGKPKELYNETELRVIFESIHGENAQNNLAFVAMVDQYFTPVEGGYRPRWLDANSDVYNADMVVGIS